MEDFDGVQYYPKKEQPYLQRIQALIDAYYGDGGVLAKEMDRIIHIQMAHEGDKWNVAPNNSTVLNLIVLQTLAMELSKR